MPGQATVNSRLVSFYDGMDVFDCTNKDDQRRTGHADKKQPLQNRPEQFHNQIHTDGF